MRPKYLIFGLPNLGLHVLEQRREENRKRRRGRRRRDKGKELCMELWFCMKSCVFWTLVGIFMVSKPRVYLGIDPKPRFVGSWVEKP